MKLLSVHVGRPSSLGGSKPTGILKKSADGPIRVGRLGLEGDFIGDDRHHGGPDQAVYLYTREDYDWWSDHLGRTLEGGTFGDNLLVSNTGAEPLRVGDRLHLGEVVLEVTAPRFPCGTLAARMEDPAFVKTFRDAARPGAYFRVLEEGDIEAGMAVRRESTMENYPTLAQVFAIWYAEDKPADVLIWMLESPLAERTRERLQEWVDRA